MSQTIDDFVERQSGVGTEKKIRRDFMSGKEARFSAKFWMQAPMFLPVGGSKKPPPAGYLHPWVVAADRASYAFRANPRPPTVFGRRDGMPVPISECTPNKLCSGDIVALTFNLVYQITDKDWFPQYQPVEIYVLKQSSMDDVLQYDTLPLIRSPPASMGASVVEGV